MGSSLLSLRFVILPYRSHLEIVTFVAENEMGTASNYPGRNVESKHLTGKVGSTKET